MATLAVEQKQQQHGYQRDDVTQGGPNQVNLGGFAISFEDLLQRVGARLENAFSAADKTSGIPASTANSDDNKSAREPVSSRDDKSERSDSRKDDTPADKSRKAASDKRDSAADRSNDNPRADAAGDNRAEQADNNSRDDVNPEKKTEKADTGRHDDKGSQDKSADSSSDTDKGKTTEQVAENGKADGAKQAGDNHASVVEAPHVAQAAAIYAAGLIGKSGNENAKTNTGDAVQQAQKGVDVVENTPAQVAAALSQKGQQSSHSNAGGKSANQNAAAKGSEQKAAASEQKGVSPALQAQAQQLSKAIGSENRVNINVNVRNDQNQLTMKTALTDTNTLVLAQDSAKSSQPAASNQPAQQQGPNTQQIQQAQLAAQQQTQAAQQNNVQNGPQGAASQANNAANTQQIGTVQSATGNAQHAGGNEALNNSTQSANAGQQTQQTQQTREAAPQQQAQHLQRATLPGSVTEQISVKISKALEAGTDKISIQLRPAELGRVDVKMEMTHDGRIMTVVSAEKQDTLDLLKRDSSELQRALADAGLQSGDMEFNLKGQERESAEADDNAKSSIGKVAETEIDDSADGPIMTAWESGIFANGRLDMRA